MKTLLMLIIYFGLVACEEKIFNPCKYNKLETRNNLIL